MSLRCLTDDCKKKRGGKRWGLCKGRDTWRELQGANDVLRAKNRSSESIATALTRRITTVAEVSNV